MDHFYNYMTKQTYPWLHSVVLFVILGGGTAMFYYTSGNQTMQLASGIATSVCYVLWGVTHHALIGDLHRKIVVEYLLIGAIAIVLLATLAL